MLTGGQPGAQVVSRQPLITAVVPRGNEHQKNMEECRQKCRNSPMRCRHDRWMPLAGTLSKRSLPGRKKRPPFRHAALFVCAVIAFWNSPVTKRHRAWFNAEPGNWLRNLGKKNGAGSFRPTLNLQGRAALISQKQFGQRIAHGRTGVGQIRPRRAKQAARRAGTTSSPTSITISPGVRRSMPAAGSWHHARLSVRIAASRQCAALIHTGTKAAADIRKH